MSHPYEVSSCFVVVVGYLVAVLVVWRQTSKGNVEAATSLSGLRELLLLCVIVV